jgi:hypothetical protein
VERSDWGGGPKGALAIARHHLVAILFGPNEAKVTEFWGRCERAAPGQSLSLMTRGASLDSRRYRKLQSTIRGDQSSRRYSWRVRAKSSQQNKICEEFSM